MLIQGNSSELKDRTDSDNDDCICGEIQGTDMGRERAGEWAVYYLSERHERFM